MATKYPENTLYKNVVELSSMIPKNKAKLTVSSSTPLNVPTPTIPTGISSLGTITTPYGGSTRYERFHPGVDIANKPGTAISSFTPGTVTKTGYSKSYGNYVEVKDPYGATARYSHLLRSYVKPGQKLTKGANLGLMGATGQTYSLTGGSGSHLDLRIKDAYNRYVNPMAYLNKTYKVT